MKIILFERMTFRNEQIFLLFSKNCNRGKFLKVFWLNLENLYTMIKDYTFIVSSFYGSLYY